MHLNLMLALMGAVDASHVLRHKPAPRDGCCQEERIEPRLIESFSKVFICCHNAELCILRQACKLQELALPCLCIVCPDKHEDPDAMRPEPLFQRI